MTSAIMKQIAAIIHEDEITPEWMEAQTDGELLDDVYDILDAKVTANTKVAMLRVFLDFAKSTP